MISCLFYACHDEESDFTSGSFYPPGTNGNNGNGEEEDTTIISAPEDTCWFMPISVAKAGDFNKLFTRYGGGWTGGDATYSIPLPDGRILWLFGDSFMGTVNADRSRAGSPFMRNAFVVQNGEDLTTLSGANNAYLKPSETGWWYWPGHGLAKGDTLQVIMFGFKSTGTGAWDFAYSSIDLITIRLPEFNFISMERKITDPKINYGACVLEDGDYTYLYGAEKAGFFKILACSQGERT